MNKKEKTVQWGSVEDFGCKGNEKFFGIDLKNENGVFLGRHKGKDLVENSKTHILGITPKRSGQGISIAIPTLIEYWKESAFIFDLKGESYHLTSGARKNNLDNMILKFAPFDEESQSFNPFEEVRFLTNKEERDVNVISKALFSEIEDRIKLENLDNLFKALVFQSFFEKSLPSASVSNGIKISNHITFDFLNEKLNDDLSSVFSENEEIPKTVDFLITKYWLKIYDEKISSRYGVAQKYFNLFCSCSEKEQKEAIKELKNILNIFTDKNLKKNTQKSDFSVTDLVNHSKPVSLYYVVHMNDLKNDVIGGIIISQIIYKATEAIYNFDFLHTNNYRCLFVMNDFSKIKKIPLYEEAMSYMMSFGLKSLIFVESISDFKRKYNDADVNYFLSNSQTQLFYGTNDINTINYVNSLIGADNDEVAKLSPTRGILKVAGKRPLLVDKVVFFLEKKLNNLVKIPTIIPESLYDKNRMYIKTDNEKTTFKYIPSIEFFDDLREKLEKMEVYLNLAADKKEFIFLKDFYELKCKQYEDYRQEYNKQFIPKIERYFKKNYSDSFEIVDQLSLKELKNISEIFNDNFKISSTFEEEGVFLGKIKDKFLIDNTAEHILLTMPVRSGKGVSCIVPTALKTWKESLFVFDIKGENYHLTSGARKEKFDNHILRFAPKSKNSCRYNPLAEVRILSDYEEEDIRMIADIICKVKELKGQDNRLYARFSSDFIFASIFYILYKNFLKKPKFVYENGRKNPVSNATITEVIEFIRERDKIGEYVKTNELLEKMKKISKENIIEMFGCNEETKNYVKEKLNDIYKNDIDQEIIKKGNHPRIAQEFSKNFKAPFFGSILSQAAYNLSIFDIPQIKENMSASDFRMYDLMNNEKPVSLYYVVSSADIFELSPITKIFIKQMFDRLTPEIDYTNPKGHKWKLLAIMDEFPALGKIEELETGIGYYAAYGIKMLLVLQSLDQLFKIYGDKNGFLSNCTTQVFGCANDKVTSNYISNTCGRTAVETGEKIYGEPLVTTEEVQRLPNNKLIINKTGMKPIFADKFIYFKEQDFYELTKIPFVISESLYDEKRKYYKLNDEQKEMICYNRNYLLSEFAIEITEEKNLEMSENIIRCAKKFAFADNIDKEYYENLMNSYSLNCFSLEKSKKGIELFKENKKI